MTEVGVRIPQPGEVLAGKYRLKRLLGEGGMGVVLEAEHLRLRQPVAIKLLSPQMLGVEQIVARFDREARAAATLRSRHVVRVTDVEQTAEGVPYIVMELLEGSDLESERERRGRLPYGEAVDYVLQACSALAEAHDAGIIHRDLKPANLFLAREDGDRVVVKVLDFGISKFTNDEDAKLTSAGAIMGTALYMSPEQIRGAASIDARSDIWAIGVILYELIGGQPPWTGPTTRVAACVVSEPAPDIRGLCAIPEPLAEAIHRMLEKDPSRRPASIADLVLEIAPYAPQGTIGADVADHLARRSSRSLGPSSSPGASSPSLPVAPISRPVAASARTPPPAGAGSEPMQPVASSRGGPEHSTMAATTTNLDGRIARPRVWGVLAGFGVIGVVGVVLIFVVARAKEPRGDDVTVAPEAPASTSPAASASSPQVEGAQAAASASSEEGEPAPAMASAASSAPTSASAKVAGAQAAAVPTVKRQPPAQSAATGTARRPTKPAETAPQDNPLFLK